MSTYRKKPVLVEAFRLPADNEEASDELIEFLCDIPNSCSEKDGALAIETLEGTMIALPGDYIIKGVTGEYYPCKPDIFNATYDEVIEQ